MVSTTDKADEWSKFLKKGIHYSVQLIIIGYLFYKLYDIGLDKVTKSLPLDPLFYLLFLVIYFSLPLSEILIYSIGWNIKASRAFLVFVQKKVLNTDVLGYSGEVYLFYWARKKINLPVNKILAFIKDNNILSSVSSTFVSVILLIFFFTQGYLNPLDYLPNSENYYVFVFTGIGVILVGFVVYKFRSYILSVSLSEGLKISAIYTFRLFITNTLQILQYALVKPDIPWEVWFSLMAVQILSTRIPFLPSQDVLYVSLALEMSDLVRVPETEIVGILTANLILKKLIGAASFVITSAKQTSMNTTDVEKDILKYQKSR